MVMHQNPEATVVFTRDRWKDRAQFTALPAVAPIESPVVVAGLGDFGCDGPKRLAVRTAYQ